MDLRVFKFKAGFGIRDLVLPYEFSQGFGLDDKGSGQRAAGI